MASWIKVLLVGELRSFSYTKEAAQIQPSAVKRTDFRTGCRLLVLSIGKTAKKTSDGGKHSHWSKKAGTGRQESQKGKNSVLSSQLSS
jgi:hypothetical protein